MNRKVSWLATAFVVTSLLVAFSNNGCGDDDEKNDIDSRTARKGEACESTRDCAPGLACVPSTNNSDVGICVVGVFNVAPTNKECVINECVTVADCCANLSPNCESLKRSCDFARDAGFGTSSGGNSSCDLFEEQCKCDDTNRGCEAGRCVTKCTDDESCERTGGSRRKCIGGKCGQCTGDPECKEINDQLSCVNSLCQPPCQTDGDCPGFERCVTGKCIDGGCQNDRECISATRNVEAKCGTDGKCIVPCETDLECGNPKGYSFFSCVSNQCVYTGCATDKDCHFFFFGSNSGTSASSSSSGSSGGSALGLNQHVFCRDKATPGATTTEPRR